MRFLFWAVLILFLWWAWRRYQARPPRNDAPTPPQAPSTDPTEMVRCRHCGVHLPQHDAVQGVLGPYCGSAHRQLAGDRNP